MPPAGRSAAAERPDPARRASVPVTSLSDPDQSRGVARQANRCPKGTPGRCRRDGLADGLLQATALIGKCAGRFTGHGSAPLFLEVGKQFPIDCAIRFQSNFRLLSRSGAEPPNHKLWHCGRRGWHRARPLSEAAGPGASGGARNRPHRPPRSSRAAIGRPELTRAPSQMRAAKRAATFASGAPASAGSLAGGVFHRARGIRMPGTARGC